MHVELEAAVARFLHKEDAVVIGMGYATNSTIIPVLCRKGDLIVSDALNHSSILRGVRGSGASVKIFKHNNALHLEQVLRQAIAQGQPRSHRPWKRIWVILEGIYSMEGEVRVPICVETICVVIAGPSCRGCRESPWVGSLEVRARCFSRYALVGSDPSRANVFELAR